MNQDWINAEFRLPVDRNMPVVVKLKDGTEETRTKVEGDWRPVVAWKPKEKKK